MTTTDIAVLVLLGIGLMGMTAVTAVSYIKPDEQRVVDPLLRTGFAFLGFVILAALVYAFGHAFFDTKSYKDDFMFSCMQHNTEAQCQERLGKS